MSLETQIIGLATRAGNECKILHNKVGSLSKLNTAAKDSAVAAINELSNRTVALEQLDLAELIDDTAVLLNKVWSSEKTQTEINKAAQQVKSDLLNGADEAFDTLKELGDAISENKDVIDSLGEIAGGAVRFDESQGLSSDEKTQARVNIAAASSEALEQFEEEVGNTDADFVEVFEAALNAEDEEAID